jgi:3-methylcrotonyl-CoA carboxylase alpha subunit
VDAGFGTGDRVPESYDSLLGKVIAWAPSRSQAAARLAAALEGIHCAGVRTNERWLARILTTPEFLEFRHSIAFLEAHVRDLKEGANVELTVERRAVACAALALHGSQERWGSSPADVPSAPAITNPWAACDGFIPNLPATVQFSLQLRGQPRPIEIQSGPRDQTTITVDATPISVAHVARVDGFVAASLDGLRVKARTFVYGSHVHVWLSGEHYDFLYEDPRLKEFSSSASRGGLTTPLPGLVAAVAVTAGQAVAAGEVLMVIEAMKMEHAITAPYAGTVQTIHFTRGDRVPEGSALLELTAPPGD